MKTVSSLPMESIKRELSIISTAIPPHSQVIYLDVPVYENIGDLLIMKGTEQFFEDFNIMVRKRYSILNFPFKKKIPQDWIIVCQGGGNFGDLYPSVQKFREKVVHYYPDHRIVILPQTIHFHDLSKQQEAMQLLSKHRDLHLFVRDEISYNIAKSYIKQLHLSPDMAHQLYPMENQHSRSKRTLGLFRTDDELASGSVNAHICDQITDWPQLLSYWDMTLVRIMVKGFRINRFIGNIMPLQQIWVHLSDQLVDKALSLYSEFGQVVTSRLHGHILACLLDKPNVLLDNSYGKNSSYYEAWTHSIPHAVLDSKIRKEEAEIESSIRLEHSDLYSKSS
jgi:pyruvyl transferase EpsO